MPNDLSQLAANALPTQDQIHLVDEIRSMGPLISYQDFCEKYACCNGIRYHYAGGYLHHFMVTCQGCSAIDGSGQRVRILAQPNRYFATDKFDFYNEQSWSDYLAAAPY